MATGQAGIFWYGGQGTFDNPNAERPTYTPGPTELGFVTLTMVALGQPPCANDTSTMQLQVVPGAYAFAGSDENGCFGVPFNFDNSASPPLGLNYDTLYWQGGTGHFLDPNAMRPTYVPGPGEIGPVLLPWWPLATLSTAILWTRWS